MFITLKGNKELVLIWAISVFLVFLTACDGGGGASSIDDPATPTSQRAESPSPTTKPASGESASPRRLTLEEFGAWCSKFEEMDFPGTYGESAKFMERIIEEGEGLSPPEVLEEYLQAYLEGSEAVHTVLSRYPEDDAVDDDHFTEALFGDSDYQASVSAQEAIEEGLPSEVYVHVSDCF